MPQVLSSREQLKKDPLQETVKKGLEWVGSHRQTFLSIIGTAAVVLVVGAFIVTNYKNVRSQAWERYSAGQNAMIMQNWDGALGLYNDVITNYGRTPAAVYALLSKGDVLHHQGKYQEAVDSYKQCLEKNPPRIILPLLLASKGTAEEDMGDFGAAVASYQKFVSEFQDHYLSPKVYESLGRAHELNHNPDAAKEIYGQIITLFPGTPWAEVAKSRYQSISPQPFQNAQPGSPDKPQ